MYNITIIGAGQLGSRHLQGLVKSSKLFRIFVIDPNEKSLIVAEERFNEVSIFTKSTVSYHQNISALPDEIDLVFIATTANVRRKIIENLLTICSVKYLILEKVVFQKSKDFIHIQNLLIKKGVNAWVNCTRRSYPFYKKIKNELVDGNISIKVMGNDWGLACNGIHMIDLLAFLTGQNDFMFNTSEIDKIIVDSKRIGFMELKGMLKIQTSQGDTLVLNDRDKYVENFEISISNDSIQFKIYEGYGLIVKHTSDNKTYEEKIEIPFQSELTGYLVDQILDTGESDLTPYVECMKYHIPMLDAFNDHISTVTGKMVTECPIT
jgi:predicted dehydrogenase